MKKSGAWKQNGENKKWEKINQVKVTDVIFLLLLLLYPMRHVRDGLDLWDTGYNYANFVYMGTEHMDPMWLFSTYLANVLGHLFSMLPYGRTLIGMNVYTGLLVSLLAGTGYVFCRKCLQVPGMAAFMGEFLAISFCWCPTALLYNYLTYVLFLAAVLLLYTGLTKKKMWQLALAGCCLGTNIFVRFSNVPEAGLILAVWAYALWEEWEVRKEKGNETDGEEREVRKEKGNETDGEKREVRKEKGNETDGEKREVRKEKGIVADWLKRAGGYTLWCLGGYAGALVCWFGWIQIRYGIADYVQGIRRLFAMTDTASDYKAGSMLRGLVFPYLDLLYWVAWMCVLTGAAMLVLWLGKGFGVIYCAGGNNSRDILTSVFAWGGRAGMVLVFSLMLWWLYANGFCSFLFFSYDSMIRPSVWFLLLTLFIGFVNVVRKECDKEERLLASLVMLVAILTSLGSNNNVMPSINNLFLAAPYTLWQLARFTDWAGKHSALGRRAEVFGLEEARKEKREGSGLEEIRKEKGEGSGLEEARKEKGESSGLEEVRKEKREGSGLEEIRKEKGEGSGLEGVRKENGEGPGLEEARKENGIVFRFAEGLRKRGAVLWPVAVGLWTIFLLYCLRLNGFKKVFVFLREEKLLALAVLLGVMAAVFIALPEGKRLPRASYVLLPEGKRLPKASCALLPEGKQFPKEPYSLWPAAVGIWGLVGMLFVHAAGFGTVFVFAEATGAQNISTGIKGNPVLEGVRMNAERAAWMQELSDYIYQEQLSGKEVLSYGKIPAVSFYFQMPAAFNPWCDLESYNYGQMEKDMQELERRIDAGEKERPVLMLEHTYHLLALGEEKALAEEGVSAERLESLKKDPKWQRISAFMEKYGYEAGFQCRKIAVWE